MRSVWADRVRYHHFERYAETWSGIAIFSFVHQRDFRARPHHADGTSLSLSVHRAQFNMLRTIRVATPRFARARSTSQPQESVITALVSSIETAARREVPWFAKQMPPAYFRQVPAGRRDAHLRAITALAAQGIRVPEVQLRDPTG